MPGGPSIDSVLRPDVTWLARDDGGRRVVLKKLPDDCLRTGKLHPAIAQRLARLREAPVVGLASLIGVERTDVGVVTVSEFVPGTPVGELPPAERIAHAPAARRLIEAVHRAGLVHGAILPGNVIVDGGGTVRLIDPSPFLYDDPAADWDDFARLWPEVSAAATDDAGPAAAGRYGPVAAAAGLATIAVAAAAGWAWHVTGQGG